MLNTRNIVMKEIYTHGSTALELMFRWKVREVMWKASFKGK